MSKSRAGAWRFVIAGLWLAACGGAVGQSTVGGESHFLQECGDGCGSGLECVSGLCTRSCLVGKSKCSDLSPSAVCTDASIEPGAVAVCDVACDGNAACSELGSGFRCLSGFCRELPQPGGAAGMPGTAGTAATAGTKSSAGAGGSSNGPDEPDLFVTPHCSGQIGGTLCPPGLACVGDPRTAETPEPSGICVQESVVDQCADDANACQDAFECVNGDCSPNGVDCVAPYLCNIPEAQACPYGYGRSRVGVVNGVANCAGPCVPLTHCACSDNAGCPQGSRCRDGQCLAELPWQPPSYCSLPFDGGTCDGLYPVYAAVNGVCTKVLYGGCDGNDNRFNTLEECLATCEGKPVPSSCPAGRVERSICAQCGVVGGCGKFFIACALPCTSNDECGDPADMSCLDGVCQVGQCI